TKVEKQGTAPEQRDGVDFEFTMVFSLNQRHYATATKDRTGIFDGKDFVITKETGNEILNWLNNCEPVEQKPIENQQKTTMQDDMIEFETQKFFNLYQDISLLDKEDQEKFKKLYQWVVKSSLKAKQENFDWLIKQISDFANLIKLAKENKPQLGIDDVNPDNLSFGMNEEVA
ncbi:MAG TPA: hypothetical protein PK771_06010, partial [Spirochaetota bacterium]|nr:hypothetical protein [Spirochaetota bacterium]